MTEVVLLPVVVLLCLSIAAVTVETLMRFIRKALGSMLGPKTICPEILRGFLQLLQVRAIFPHPSLFVIS
jgi:hypothetical protein